LKHEETTASDGGTVVALPQRTTRQCEPTGRDAGKEPSWQQASYSRALVHPCLQAADNVRYRALQSEIPGPTCTRGPIADAVRALRVLQPAS